MIRDTGFEFNRSFAERYTAGCMPRFTRRSFLATPLALQAAQTTAPDAFDRVQRWFQLAFTEDDPGKYDVKFWLDYFDRLKIQGVCLSAGGCVAFYPSEIPYHHKSQFMKPGMDPFGDLARACKSKGMTVLARIDPHGIHDEAAKAHPEWVQIQQDGTPRRHWADAQYWVTCAAGPYNAEFMPQVIREIVTRYPVDGIFANRWTGHGRCYCSVCKPHGDGYRGWHQERLFEVQRLWDAEIKKARPGAAYIPNSGGGSTSELDMTVLTKGVPFLAADRQARRGVTVPWAAGKNAKEYRATMGRRPVAGITSVGLEEPYRWKDSTQSAAEIKVWMADGVAQGMRPWIIKFNAKPYDKRWLGPVEEFYRWHAANERYLKNEEPLATVGVVYSQQTGALLGAKTEDFISGVCHALVEARIPFEMVHDRQMDRRFRVLVLPNIAALSDAQCTQVRQHVQSGGGLVATHETSLYDEHGKRRSDFGLADLFGVNYDGKTEGPVQNSYLNVDDPRHPLMKGLEDVGRMVGGANQVRVKSSRKPLAVPLTDVPSYPDLPMEEVWPRVPRTDHPGVFLQERVVYFPWDIDRTFWEVLSPDHGRLLANAVRWAAGEPMPVEIEGPGLVDVALWRQSSSMTLHVVNLTNPMAMKGPFREIVPLAPLKVRLRMKAQPRSAKWLVSGKPALLRAVAGAVECETPAIGLHEVLAMDI